MKLKDLLFTGITILALATSTIAQTVPDYVPTNGLIGWWPFNGNANDESGNGNNGTVSGATLSIDRLGDTNSAYAFNGYNTRLDFMNIDFNQRTISLWMNPNVGTNFGVALDCEHPYLKYGLSQIYVDRGRVYAGFGGYSPYNASCIMTNSYSNTWYSVIITRNADSTRFYLNDSLICTSLNANLPTTGTGAPMPSITRIGCSDVFDRYFKGSIDDIGVWGRALTECEVNNLYLGQKQPKITRHPKSQSRNIGSDIQLIVASSDPLATYQWQTDLGFGFQNLTNAGQYSGATEDTLMVTNAWGNNHNQSFRSIITHICSDTSDVAVLQIYSGIKERKVVKSFSIYPNPATDHIYVRSDGALKGCTYTVFDQVGEIVTKGNIQSEMTVIELGNLSSGIYMISIGDNLKQSIKIIRQ